ncbi:hypothetical protein P171DRAFT_447862 [Karstenula rhodostoma CBS 690.94]|uniref:Uncharacterized protein n=1 Tax=Karstenula rhodostoma CBS 690.94 TaxID=1392251 RepID=A0A9P4PBB1_9PLEO|nr:hypothetical protein P171DRAFT_447862 [Karstenula rhodostoma CBS 690.94]
MSARSSPAEPEAAQALLSLSSSSGNNLGGTGDQLPVLGPSETRVRPRWPVEQPLRGPRALKASLIKADVHNYRQRLAGEQQAQGSDGGEKTSFWKILTILRFLVTDYATAIKECNRSGLAEFFIKVDCLGALFGLIEKRTPTAEWFDDYMNTVYSVQDFPELTLWGMIDNFLDGEDWQLEGLQIDMADAIESRDFEAMRAIRNSIKTGPRETLYMLRCMWWWFREQTPVYAASLLVH